MVTMRFVFLMLCVTSAARAELGGRIVSPDGPLEPLE
jgi:hypothetical protein